MPKHTTMDNYEFSVDDAVSPEVMMDIVRPDIDDTTSGSVSSSDETTSKAARSKASARTAVTSSTTSSSDSRRAAENKKAFADGNNNPTCSSWWTEAVLCIHRPIIQLLDAITSKAAKNPWITIGFSIALSLGLATAGVFTNFSLNVNEHELWTPVGSNPEAHYSWISNNETSGFVESKRWVAMLLHNEGENVLHHDAMEYVFSVVDSVRNVSSYAPACAEGQDLERPEECSVFGVTNFWDDSFASFQETAVTDDDVRLAMSTTRSPEGLPILQKLLFGYPVRNETTKQLESAQSLTVVLYMPNTPTAPMWETEALEALKNLPPRSDGLRLEFHSKYSLGQEVVRAISEDIPLVPLIFLAMSLFTALVFSKRSAVESRGTLGFGAVVAVLLSLLSGFGLMFTIGVPLTSVTQISPFIIFGIGLDDALILMGSYCRTDPRADPVARISETIHDVGLSVTLTTLTSASAFALGYISSIPAIQWLCLYACPTILFVYLYQLTFFVACIVVDERRLAARRKDPLLCCLPRSSTEQPSENKNVVDSFMESYAKQLVRPWVRVLVIAGFGTLLGFCLMSAQQFEQEFAITDVLPSDSYITSFSSATGEYQDVGTLPTKIYFRDVDQSDPEVRKQMRSFLADLGETDIFEKRPQMLWMDSFDIFVGFNMTLRAMPFKQQMDLFLDHPVFYKLFHLDITRDNDGNVIASRTTMRMKVDLNNITEQVQALELQNNISMSQEINEGRERLAFFTYDGVYNMWEFFKIAVDELTFTTASCVVAVAIVTLVLMPHWTASFFVLPLVVILYVDLVGVMQWAGLHINAVSYISLVMSVGILVDFLMHCLFRYYECDGNRIEKTIEMLRTMGSSILLGGMTTFLGIVPLMFCSSDLFATVFYCFLGIVTLGIGHGLILLPVLLATFGPEDQIHVGKRPNSSRKIPAMMDRQNLAAIHEATADIENQSSMIVYVKTQPETDPEPEIVHL